MVNKKTAWTLMRGGLLVALCCVSALVGGAFSRRLGVSTYTLSYADFVSIMLTACSVLLALVTMILAVLGVLGWNAIANGVRTRTNDFLNEGFQQGNHLYSMVEAKVTEIMYEGVSTVNSNSEDGESGSGGGNGV